MSMCSLTDFIEVSLGPERMLVRTATVTGQGASQVDTSVRGGDFSWPKAGTFVAKSGDLRWPKPGTFSWPRTTMADPDDSRRQLTARVVGHFVGQNSRDHWHEWLPESVGWVKPTSSTLRMSR